MFRLDHALDPEQARVLYCISRVGLNVESIEGAVSLAISSGA